MRGNDIIDIKAAAQESNWRRTGFLQKIFTSRECSYIKESVEPEKMVWTLWSIKESVYKAYTRQFGGRFFAPKNISCILLPGCIGTATINERAFHTTSQITDAYIYTSAKCATSDTAPLVEFLFSYITDDYKKQQELMYQKIINNYAAITQQGIKQLSIKKNTNGIPFIHIKREQLAIPVSITHHGYFGAFTIN
ncbi:MAG: 4-phosphopantetheinyl transferase family protein [Chitinophagaceae bacterium]|nr:4-phosphopantetheinyl transferase family protein [Chitinophagaceae bacterium]MBK8298885.1 4-phosphopantetheinyl transferase family protein [Chitinophagaceae bacterium]MBK9659934.1 4-phosphopantetheinyl transferase family protein [Chitinophagaceae bacterium]MBK9938087.1 4-phosphopantetheinyl transferase family protein [Chitinophagaceae bacterium]MBP6232144.1 4-phosphopantetheinyl transferase family protein [Chitinophagaceae bacterium]